MPFIFYSLGSFRLSVAPGVGYGWAVVADQTHGRSTDKEVSEDNVNYTSSETESVGYGEHGAHTEIKEFMPDGYKSPYAQETGGTLGLGATHTVGANLTFTFLRLPLDKNYLLSNFILKK